MAQASANKSAPKPPPEKMTYRQFLRRYMNGEHLEWVNGEVIPMSSVTDDHNDLGIFLLVAISEFAEVNGLGKTLHEPFNMKIGPNLPGRSPDILFVAKENLSRLKHTFLDGPSDLAVEIISLGGRRIDRVVKFAEYEQGGAREYWIMDTKRKEAEFYVRDDSGKFQRVSIGEEGIYHSTVLAGFWLKMEWLWQRPRPAALAVAKEWGIL